MRYFAYGSNMDWPQLRRRCPTARFVSVAVACGHRLAFTRYSPRRCCGVADMIVDARGEVWGAIFEIGACDLANLDRCEGYCPDRPASQNGYARRQITVRIAHRRSAPVSVYSYFVVDKLESPATPSAAYRQHLLDGARHWRLPPAYIRQLERIEVA